MRDLSSKVEAETSNLQADVGKIQQYLDICAQASARIYCIRETGGDVPISPEKEQVPTNDSRSMPTLEVLTEFAELLASISTRFENDIADVRTRLDSLLSQIIQANKAARQQRYRTESCLSISSCSPAQRNEGMPNVYQTISTTDGSQQITVSTSGDSIYARNITTASRSSSWLGQMSDVSLQLLLRDVTSHNSH